VSRTDDAIASIKQMIVTGELRPGDRLPREPDLAERLNLSRNSLREAVRALSLIRVLDVRQGDGTYVTDLDPTTLLETFASSSTCTAPTTCCTSSTSAVCSSRRRRRSPPRR
jgi:DNA-binding FadR family transcriptional regulator